MPCEKVSEEKSLSRAKLDTDINSTVIEKPYKPSSEENQKFKNI